MLNEKTLVTTISAISGQLKAAVEDVEQYRKWWQDEAAKTAELNATIEKQHAEILRLTEEVNNYRETGTIVVHEKERREEQDSDQHSEISQA